MPSDAELDQIDDQLEKLLIEEGSQGSSGLDLQ